MIDKRAMKMPRKLFRSEEDRAAQGELNGAPLGGTKAEAMQRLQVGLSGLAAMVLIVGLASIIQNRALISEETAVPEAAPTTEPTEAAPQRDPLVDAGVVPDLPADPSPTPTQEAAIVPEQGAGLGDDERADLLTEDAQEP